MDLYLFGLVIGFAIMVFARRWHNNDPDAGKAISGWGIVTIIIYIIASHGGLQ